MRWLVGAALFAMVSVASVVRADDGDTPCKVRTGKITATFAPETSIKDLATWVMGFTCKNIVIDSSALDCSAKVAILAPNPMSTKQAMQLFYDAVEATGLVVKNKKETILVMVDPKSTRSCTANPLASSASSVPATSMPPPPMPTAEEEQLAIDMELGIKQIDTTHYQIKGSLIDTILGNPMAMAKGARVVPAVRDGKPDGFKLYAIRPGSLYARLGLSNGDTIQSVSGMSLDSADKALEVYTKLRDATELTVDLVRRGKPLRFVYKITK